MAAINVVTLTLDRPLTIGSILPWNFRSVSTPSCSSAQRGIQNIFFYPSAQDSDHSVMVTINIRGFAGVVRFLMELFDAWHLFGFFADFDAVSGQQQTATNFDQGTTEQNNLPPALHDGFQIPRRCPEKPKEGRVKLRLNTQPTHKRADPIVVEPDHKAKN